MARSLDDRPRYPLPLPVTRYPSPVTRYPLASHVPPERSISRRRGQGVKEYRPGYRKALGGRHPTLPGCPGASQLAF
jgi:hypothetical protein